MKFQIKEQKQNSQFSNQQITSIRKHLMLKFQVFTQYEHDCYFLFNG